MMICVGVVSIACLVLICQDDQIQLRCYTNSNKNHSFFESGDEIRGQMRFNVKPLCNKIQFKRVVCVYDINRKITRTYTFRQS